MYLCLMWFLLYVSLNWGGGVGGRYFSKFYYLNINWIFGDFRDFIKKVFEDLIFCM